jgi:phage antirepressor YoqD-like protein
MRFFFAVDGYESNQYEEAIGLKELALVKSASFGNVQCDFYSNNDEILMTRDQIGTALEYEDPRTAIAKIHERHADRLGKFSTVTKLTTVEGGRDVTREIILYTAKGVYEICRWSQQPKANNFYDFVYETLESLRKGDAILQYRLPTTFQDALRMLADEVDHREQLQRQNQIMVPKAEMYDVLLSANNSQTMNQVAKAFGWGRNRLFSFLRKNDVLMSNNLPYQRFLDDDYFEVREVSSKGGDMTLNFTQTLVTPKGIDYIGKLLARNGNVLPMIKNA